MQTWEYTWIEDTDARHALAVLNERGQTGWEAFAIESSGSMFRRIWLKRPLTLADPSPAVKPFAQREIADH